MRYKNFNYGATLAEKAAMQEADRLVAIEDAEERADALACEWQSSVGHVAISVFGGHDIMVSVNDHSGEYFIATDIRPLTALQRAKYPASIVACLGKYGLTQERKETIEAKLAQKKAR